MLGLSQCLTLQLGKGSEEARKDYHTNLFRSKPGGHCLEHTFHDDKRRGQDAKGKSELWAWSSWVLYVGVVLFFSSVRFSQVLCASLSHT